MFEILIIVGQIMDMGLARAFTLGNIIIKIFVLKISPKFELFKKS